MIDPIILARFMVMDGASRLITAFSGIPEGPLRESVITMAETMRDTYAGGAVQPFADPLAAITPPPPRPPPALPGPGLGPKTSDPKLKAVQFRLEGLKTPEIAERTGLPIHQVYHAVSEARKAGVKFPMVGRAEQHSGDAFIRSVYLMREDQLTSSQAVAAATRASNARGISIGDYLARKKLALDMALDGRHVRAIVEATKESKLTLQAWMHSAREAGFPVPYMADLSHIEPAPPPTAEVIDLKPRRKADDPHRGRFILTMEEYDQQRGKGAGGITKGAELMGVPVDEFLRLRREALVRFKLGQTPFLVSRDLGITQKQAENWRGRAQRAGVLDLTPLGAHRAALKPRTP